MPKTSLDDMVKVPRVIVTIGAIAAVFAGAIIISLFR
jgi:hypothetical protein